jgi:hypothetical protein
MRNKPAATRNVARHALLNTGLDGRHSANAVASPQRWMLQTLASPSCREQEMKS